MTILITGAAGNLGSILARHLVPRGRELRLMYHRKPLAADLAAAYPAAREVLDTVDKALGSPLSALMADGPEDELTLTTAI